MSGVPVPILIGGITILVVSAIAVGVQVWRWYTGRGGE